MKKKQLSASILAFSSVLSLILSSCGGDFSSSASSNEESSSSTEGDDGEGGIILEKDNGTYHLNEENRNEDSSLCYEIFVRSFYDSDGDKIGDLNGIAEKASYLKKLGVGNVWLMPIFPSPSYHGYDVTDYYNINSDYGSLADFKNMVNVLHQNGIKVILDMVLNHSSIDHTWFNESYLDYSEHNIASDSKADWYVWSNEKTNQNYYQKGNAYYEANFDSGMPEFNFDCEAVQKEFKSILTYWLNQGVDGFRFDAVRYFYYGNTEKNIAALNTLVEDVKAEYPNAYFVGENWTTGDDYYAYYESKFNSFFNFAYSSSQVGGNQNIVSASKGIVAGDTFTSALESNEKAIKEQNESSYCSYFISNHDMDRPTASLTGNYAKMAASITYLLPGTPYIYYGEEISLKGSRGSSNTDANRRLPMIWSESDKEGETVLKEQVGDVDQVKKGAMDLLEEPMSLTNHYRKVAQIRNKYSFIKNASFESVKTLDRNLIAYRLNGDAASILVVHNTSTENKRLNVSNIGSSILDEINTSNQIPTLKNGELEIGSQSSVVLSTLS